MSDPREGSSPLFVEGWVAYNERQWDLQSLVLDFHPPDAELPSLRALLYIDQKGRIVLPPRVPYIPIDFHSTPSDRLPHISRQWLEMSDQMAAKMQEHGAYNTLQLSPEAKDIRSWYWHGFQSTVRYTFYLDFPIDESRIDPATRRHWRKAIREGYYCQPPKRMEHVLECLKETEERKGYSHHLSLQELQLIQEQVGETHYRILVCYAADGNPVSTTIFLTQQGTRALLLMLGTKTEHLSKGVTQLIQKVGFEDLQAIGATGVDLIGANLPGVSASKEVWGPTLLPYYTLESMNFRQLAKRFRDWGRFRALGKKLNADTDVSSHL